MALVVNAASKDRTLPSQLTKVPAFSWWAATGSTTSATSVTALDRSSRETTKDLVKASSRSDEPIRSAGSTPPTSKPPSPPELAASMIAEVSRPTLSGSPTTSHACLLYTSDAADDLTRVDL